MKHRRSDPFHIKPAPAPDRRQFLVAGLTAPVLLALPTLTGCADRGPRLALLAGLTGPASDLGVAGRDGAVLAIEDAAARTGATLLEFDDGQQPEQIAALAQRIANSDVTAVIGPMTSSIARVWIPEAERLGLVTVSPTVTSHDFAGQDDGFFRVCATTREYARRSAEFAVQTRRWQRFAIVRDDSNAPYTRSWAEHFVARAREMGATVPDIIVYHRTQGPNRDPAQAAQAAPSQRPEVLVIVANAADTAVMAQTTHARPDPPALLASEWAATDQLIVGGGRSVEGLMVTQFLDRNSRAPAYLTFAQRFVLRYGRDPGFVETAAYDATRVVLQALDAQRHREPLKATLLRLRRFDGLQNPIEFDDFGDCSRPLVVTEVRNGRYVVVG